MISNYKEKWRREKPEYPEKAPNTNLANRDIKSRKVGGWGEGLPQAGVDNSAFAWHAFT